MSPSEISFWKQAADEHELEIVAPFELTLPDGAQLKVTALIRKFGARNGMVVDEDWALLKPNAQALVDLGYGFSAISSELAQLHARENLIETLTDWGWTGPADQKPRWFRENSD
jgi:hypothetical protein